MSPLLSTFIAAELASVPRIVPTPNGVLGFGADLDCLSDITLTGTETGDVQKLLTQWTVHALSTTKGMLPGDSREEQSFGLNLLDMIGQDAGSNNARQWELAIRAELLKNEQLADASAVVSLTSSSEGQSFDVAITLTPADPSVAPFSLVLTVTPLGVFLATVEAQS